jgi:outer membrane protein assembly factor BamB
MCVVAVIWCVSGGEATAADCTGTARRLDPASPVLAEGWAYDERNTRARRGDEIRLEAADVPNLELRWSFVFPGEVERRAPPIVTEQAVIAGATGGLYAIDRATGCRIWRRLIPDQVRTGLVLGPDASGRGRLIYFGTLTGAVYAVDFETGRVVWR